MQPSVFTLYESSSQLLTRRLLIFGGSAVVSLLGVVMCGVVGGIGAAFTAMVMLGFATVLALFVASLGIVPFLDARHVGQVTVERSAVRESKTGRRIDFAQPHTVAVLCSQRVVRTRVKGRYAEYEQSLAYDWVALVFEQGATRLTFTQPHVDASYDSGMRGERRVNRGFLGRPPTPYGARPDGLAVDLMQFDDFERALGKAVSEGFRLGLVARAG
ncbi:MAG: hypothetical protein K1X94_33430 [Sandaracinaceae bacterium]|nr:hypothetical protein [Sandaracinaceae bacterium]